MKYSLFVVICLVIHAVINIDIFRKKPTVNLPALRAYRVFVLGTAIYFLSDMLWGVFEENKLAVALYVDTVVYFVTMGFGILAWARYTVRYLESKGWFAKAALIIGNCFFLAEIVLLIVNFFTPILFRVDMDTVAYETFRARNIMLYVQFLMYVLLTVYTIVHTIRTHSTFQRRYMTIAFYSIAMGTAIVFQIYYPYLPVYSIGAIVGSTLLNSFVISDIKEEYKSALAESRVQVEQGQSQLAEAKVIAYTDPMTGIANKHAYVEEEERIDKLIAQGEMPDFAVIVFDLNGLKHVNDTLGHDAGDAYIIDSVKTIEHFFGKDHLYRFGGDEFVLILEDDDFASRSKKLSDFERHIDNCLSSDKPIIASGMSRYRKGTDNTYHAVFYRADKIMYARKEALKEHHD